MRKFAIAGFVVVALVAAGAIVAFSPAAYGQMPGVRRGEVPPGPVLPLLRTGSEIGVSVREVARDDVSKMKLPAEAGAVIEEVRRGGPADRAGLRQGDVVVGFDGEKVRSAGQLTRLVRETPPGREVKAAFIRDGRRTEVQVIPAEAEGLRMPFDGEELRQSLERVMPRQMRRGALGVTIQEMTPDLATYFGAKDGILVTSVAKESPAEKAGIKVGDVITEVAGKPVNDSGDFVRQVQSHDREMALKLVRDKKELTLKVTPERRSERQSRIFRGV